MLEQQSLGRSSVLWRVLVAMITLLAGEALHAASLYAVGNSLTNDLYMDGLQILAHDSGAQLTADYHIRGSGSMTYMVANPADVTLSRPNTWNVALQSGTYDFISLAPYNGLGAPSAASESAAISTAIEAALAGPSRNAIVYLYSAWPNRDDTGGNFEQYWLQGTAIPGSQPPLQTRGYYDQLLGGLATHFGNRVVLRVIPVGDVFARIDHDAKAGLIPGIADMNMLYRDQIHMGEVGRFVAASTMFATLFQRKSTASSAVDVYQFNDGAAQLTPTLAAQLENIVWSVVSLDPRTGASNNSSSSSSSSSSASSSSSSSSSSSTPTSSSTSGSGSIDLAMLLGLLLCLRYRHAGMLRSTRRINT